MPSVRVRENEYFDAALQRFKRACEKAGILTELRRREFYEKPTQERKRKKAAAIKRHMKRVSLDGRGLLALALLGGLLVELAPTQLGENAGLLTGALEAPQGGIEVLILTNSNARHRNLKSLIGMGFAPDRPDPRRLRVAQGAGDSKGARGQRQRRAAHRRIGRRPAGSGAGPPGARAAGIMTSDASIEAHDEGIRTARE